MEIRRIYLRSTDTSGRVSITEHACWDADLFVATRQDEARKANAEFAELHEDAIPLAKAETITQDEYRALVWPKHVRATRI